ncbi:unannotated protein [freshwater metagenome]|uniref:Unannotated protein n=1 Tax=freshwater metagenome TaxID=449393 RepID=A0A6J7PPU8_9ZZZZ
MMGWYEDGWGVNGWSTTGMFGMVMMIAVWGGLIGLAVWAVARFTRTERHASSGLESPRTILDRRFASGEIDAQEYAQARRILESSGTVGAGPSPT